MGGGGGGGSQSSQPPKQKMSEKCLSNVGIDHEMSEICTTK